MVYLPLCKVAENPFIAKGHDLSNTRGTDLLAPSPSNSLSTDLPSMCGGASIPAMSSRVGAISTLSTMLGTLGER